MFVLIMDFENSYKFIWIVISLQMYQKLRIDIGDYDRKRNYKKVLLSKTLLTLDATGKYGKPDVINYASAGTVVHDSSGSPIVDLRCKKCRYSLILSPLMTDES